MKIADINTDESTKKNMLPSMTNKVPFGGIYRPCQPVKPTTEVENPVSNPCFQGKHVVPTDDQKGGTLNIIA